MEQFKARLKEVKAQLLAGTLDEIPLDARPKMVDFDFDKDSFVVVSYSRKDFEEVYLFLEYLHRAGCRFWYDAGMLGTDTWIKEFENKYENPNCLGTITFFSENYISDSTKAELDIVFDGDHYRKQNMMISLVGLAEMTPDMVLIKALTAGRISIENAAAVKPVLATLIQSEKERTIHRYSGEEAIPALVEKLEQIFSVQEEPLVETWSAKDFIIADGVLYKYVGQDAVVTIPSGVHTIGERAFQGCTTITHVIVPDGVCSIEGNAFAECTALEDIALPESMANIGERAFFGCASLKGVEIPRGVTAISTWTFGYCQALASAVLPDSLTDIGDHAFCCCRSLSDITIPDGVVCIGQYAFVECYRFKSVTIPGSVSSLGNNAFFRCKALENVVIEDGVRTIEEQAFASCSSLKKITIPDSVVELGVLMFESCYELTTVVLSNNIKQIPSQTFQYCKALEDIQIPNGVECIESLAFGYCISLMRIVIPSGVRVIRQGAFADCCDLSEVIIPAELAEIGYAAFQGCSDLTQLTYQGTMQQWEQVQFEARETDSIQRIQCTDGVVEL